MIGTSRRFGKNHAAGWHKVEQGICPRCDCALVPLEVIDTSTVQGQKCTRCNVWFVDQARERESVEP